MDVATLGVTVDPSGVIAGTSKVNAALDLTERKGTLMAAGLKHALAGVAAFLAGAAILKGIHEVLDATEEAQDATAQLEAAVRSTGGAAGYTVTQLQSMAMQLQQVTKFSDEAIMSAQAMLLVFRNIRGDNFRDATVAVTDLAARMGGDLQGAALQIGKALQDPIMGLTTLRRAGISFSDAQKDVIKSLVQSGHLVEAQATMLRELKVQFGGSATAARETLGGALRGLANDFNDTLEATKGETSALIDFINAVGAAVRVVSEHREGLKTLGIAVLSVAAGYGVLATAMGGVSVGMAALIVRFAAFTIGTTTATAAVTGFGVAGAAAIAVVPVAILAGAFVLLVKTIQNARDEMRLTEREMDGMDQTSRQMEAINYRRARAQMYERQQNMDALAAERKAIEDTRRLFGDVLGHLPTSPDAGKLPTTMSPEDFAKQRVDRESALRQQLALNTAYHETGHELNVLRIQQEAETERRTNAIGHTREQTAVLNRLTSQMEAAKIAAENLSVATDRHRQAMDAFNQALGTAHQRMVDEWQNSANKNVEATQRQIDKLAEYEARIKRVTAAMSQAKELGSIGPQGGGSEKDMNAGGLIGLLGGLNFGGNGVSGILSVFQAIPGIGAVAGGVAGLLGKLTDAIFGAGEAAYDSASALDASRRKVETTLSFRRYRNSIEGTPLQGELDKLDISYRQWREQIKNDVPDVAGPSGRHDMLAELDRLNAIAVQRAKDEDAARQREAIEDYKVRMLRAKGASAEADALEFAEKLQREYAKAVRDGASATELAGLAEAQKAEAEQHARDVTMARTRAMEDLNVRLLRAQGDGAADDVAFALQQQREYEDAVRSGADATYLARLRQVQLAEATQKTSDKIKDTISKMKDTVTSLNTFKLSLLFGSQSTASPTDQLEAARREYESTRALALAGDQVAAARFPDVARAFLDISRMVNASGVLFQRDLRDVQDTIDSITAIFQGQIDTQQAMLDALGANGPIATAIGQVITETVPVLFAGFQELSKKTDLLSDKVEQSNNRIAKALEGLSLN